jgi:hypothetical protein
MFRNDAGSIEKSIFSRARLAERLCDSASGATRRAGDDRHLSGERSH